MFLVSLLSWTALSQGPLSDTPGFSYLGSGYDLLSGNPLATDGLGDPGFRENLFDWAYTEGLRTSDNAYKIADKTQSRTFSVCSTSMDEQVYNSAYSYQHIISTNVDIDAGFGTKGNRVDFGLNIDVQNTRNHTDKREAIYAHVSAVCTRYQLSMYTFDRANMTSDFQMAVAELPLTFENETYMDFLKTFGTHYISSMKVGGRWGLQMAFKSKDFQSLEDSHTNINAGIKFVAKDANGGFNVTSKDDQKTKYAISSRIWKNSTFSVGGEFNHDPDAWMKSVGKAPMPVFLTLNRLEKLFTSRGLPHEEPKPLAAKKAGIVKAIAGYCSYMQSKTPGFSCTPQKPIPMPTPSPIGENAVRRVCVNNSGVYMLYSRVTLGSYSKANGWKWNYGEWSESYSNGNYHCFDGTDVNAKRGDVLSCFGGAVWGDQADCGTNNQQFDPQSTLQANYHCYGTTLNIWCSYTGVSTISG